MLKEKSIYYDSVKEAYYLVLSVSDMVYGRYGDMNNPSYLDCYMHSDEGELRFQIDNITINMESYRNYRLDDSEINNFVFVRELTDEEFYPMELLIDSNCRFPDCIINIDKSKNNVTELVKLLRDKKQKLWDLKKEIRILEKDLFKTMTEK